MDSISSTTFTHALAHGSVGWYGATQRVFLLFAATAGPACCFIDAPFGRFPGRSILTINGNVGWLLMEIVSPITFCLALTTPISSTGSILRIPTLVQLADTFHMLPIARRILAALFLVHYLNRAVVSTFRNPGRAPMHISVPLAAIFFNVLNGGLQGFWLAGGVGIGRGGGAQGWGLKDAPWATSAFVAGIVLWTAGFVGNIVSDEILYSLKRARPCLRPNPTPKERYSIPHGFLYSKPFGGVSHPAYFTEWIEWTGYVLATAALTPTLFPLDALANAGAGKLWITIFPPPAATVLRKVPKGLWPLPGWALQPPMLFLWNEISAMLPRAYSGHQWYKRTFGADWPKERKIVIPGLL